MKKSRKREFARERHSETCMCRKCRAREEALFFRRGQKIRPQEYKDLVKENYDD